MSRPMATELTQIAVGDWDVIDRGVHAGVAVRDVLPPSLAGLAPDLKAEDAHLAWLQQRLGAYPFSNYGTFVVDAQLGFALETQTLSLFDRPWFTLYDRALWDPVMLHELAHMWFGDSVSPWSWSDVWLNEGHASWYQHVWAARHGWLGYETGTGIQDFTAFMKSVYAQGDQMRSDDGPVARPSWGRSPACSARTSTTAARSCSTPCARRSATTTFGRIERAWVTTYRGQLRLDGGLHRAGLEPRQAQPRRVPAPLGLRDDDAAHAGAPGLDRGSGHGRRGAAGPVGLRGTPEVSGLTQPASRGYLAAMRRPIRLLAPLLFLLLAAAPAARRPPHARLGGPRRPAVPKLGNGGYDVARLQGRPPLRDERPAQALLGTATIKAKATKALSRFDLDFAGDAVGSVSVERRGGTLAPRSGEELVITPAQPLQSGAASPSRSRASPRTRRSPRRTTRAHGVLRHAHGVGHGAPAHLRARHLPEQRPPARQGDVHLRHQRPRGRDGGGQRRPRRRAPGQRPGDRRVPDGPAHGHRAHQIAVGNWDR